MKQLLFNPFIRIAGARSLLLGWLLMLLTAVIAYFSYCHFDGVIDAHDGCAAPFWIFLAEPLLAWGVAVLVFYLAGIIVARSGVRLIDIAGTLALARWPMLVVAIACFIPVTAPRNLYDIQPSVIMLGIVMLPFIIWMIALLYNAYSISTGVRGGKRIWSFIIALVIAEALSKALFFWLLADYIR